MQESLQAVHRVLEFILTKAAVSAKLTKSTVRIPYKDLMASIGRETTKDIDLVLTIETAWDEKGDVECDIEETETIK